MTATVSTKLLILGLDGVTFDLIKPWAEAGHLPNLARLMAQGTHGDLMSTLPPVTSPAWPTFMTGCNPGKHGVFDFITPAGNGFDLVNSSKIKQPTLWQLLSEAGYRVGVLNVPVTYPAQALNGYMVTGILSPKAGQISYPADLIDRHKDVVGPYRVAPNVQFKRGNEDAFLEDILDLIRAHGEWALHLMQNEPTDVQMVHFIALDLMMHALWRYMDESHPDYVDSPWKDGIRKGYQQVDTYVGRMLDLLPDDAHVVVMSDHGFGPLHNIVNLNNYLIEKGFMTLRRDPMTRLRSAAFKYGITPQTVYRMVETIGLQNLATRVSKNTRNQVLGKFLSFDSVEWGQTVAYSMGHVGQIYINRIGREPNGVVSDAEYESVRQQVVDALRELKDENGRPLVDEIVVREETYHGAYMNDGPDIHIVLDGYNMIAYPLFATNGQVITKQIRGDSGCHRSEGVFIAHGPNIQAGGLTGRATLTDIAPTLLAILDEHVPTHMDGNVLTEIFEEAPEIKYLESDDVWGSDDELLNSAEQKEIEERLRGLGYL